MSSSDRTYESHDHEDREFKRLVADVLRFSRTGKNINTEKRKLNSNLTFDNNSKLFEYTIQSLKRICRHFGH